MNVKRVFARRTEGSTAEAAEAVPDAAPAEVGGWSTGARANTTALLRWGAWALLVLGPVLGAAALVAQPTSSEQRPAPAARSAAGNGSQGAAGFATLYVSAYLRAGEGDEDALAAYYPPARGLRLDGAPGRRHVEELTVARLRQTAPAVWSVTVAARVSQPAATDTDVDDAKDAARDTGAGEHGEGDAERAGAVRYFQVPVAVGTTAGRDAGSGYVALGLPGEVSSPARIKSPELVYGTLRSAQPGDPRTRAAGDFLSAYLSGASGDLNRYLAPGTKIRPVRPAPYRDVEVEQTAFDGEQSSTVQSQVPADGTRQRALVSVLATEPDGIRTPLTYALTLTARAGRWEIAALDGAPTVLPAAPPPPSTPAS
ncbi:conjugal transfer protein [Streptomyces aurantiacus]|uniref:Conjugative transposon protein TcpC n=1 Tax=Streptomyces aurantiacus JA 4570 TaxID=1286094 RepID=S3ZCT5_9ACTN|nr:conjugal transfer protein [Streptomyces aurantiacus]EPH40948.1 hypothetical protein STRAU_5990 [Streptomyces aurantiacus JA 4570]